MPEPFRPLIVILFLATVSFVFARRFASTFTDLGNFTRRRNLWFALTLAAFLTHDFWIYLLIASPLLIYAYRREAVPSALYFFVLFVLPIGHVGIPGFGLINYFFDLTNPRILVMLILLPAFIVLLQQRGNNSFGRTAPDKALIAYLTLAAILDLRETSITDTIRQVFYLVIDVFLPYFVISRSQKDLKIFRDSLMSLVLAIMVLALFAVFESSRHWLLYISVIDALKLDVGRMGYPSREGIQRAVVTAGTPIALGYLMVVGMGIYLFLKRSIQQKFFRRCCMALLTAGLVAALSRGPWVGAVILLIVFIATGRYAARGLISLALVTLLGLPLVSMLPGGDKVINLLPFIGETEKGTIYYREKLITNSMIVIKRNPLFGSADYFNAPEMEDLRQGQGIIDIVNTYLVVALEKGLTGLGLFVAFFFLTLRGIYLAMHSIQDKDSEEYLLGRVLLATLSAILIMIFTMSSVSFIPIMYWAVAGLGVAYTQMLRNHSNRMEVK